MIQAVVNTAGFPPNMTLMPLIGGAAGGGGFSIVISGKLVGALGTSGGTFAQDAVVAKAALTAFVE